MYVMVLFVASSIARHRKVKTMTKTELEIKSLTEKEINKLGYKLYDVMFLKEAGQWYLRFFIEKEDKDNVDLDDCEKVSQALDVILEEKDPIAESYNLEVSSCGLERHIREPEHFKWAVGKKIQFSTFKPIDKQKNFEGTLISYDDGVIKIDTDEKQIEVFESDIAGCKILYNWEELENGKE